MEFDLKLKLELHLKWLRDEDGGERLDLSGKDLSAADLSAADLRRANLSAIPGRQGQQGSTVSGRGPPDEAAPAGMQSLQSRTLHRDAGEDGGENKIIREKLMSNGKMSLTIEIDMDAWADEIEHDNPADYYNTCLKMAKKRAFVDAILTSTAASDVFTQDLEDQPEAYGGKPGPRRLNIESIKATLTACLTLDQLDAALSDLGIDKRHPDAKVVADIYKEVKANIEAANVDNNF